MTRFVEAVRDTVIAVTLLVIAITLLRLLLVIAP
jgi:hypothetical protein